ncbi:hypothetical protein FE257_012125 [Aspergillus nanangensis]|uniref:Cation-transporting P-type ATPase N-terminal domain-containing protein n=1 Tax=Aspergillus nanangensis TaxID=2582783 RepID=A0AAD4CGJ9_ASPNN|nr:hypothetical protein FE257_012125 [Aspergillus nanangensis]
MHQSSPSSDPLGKDPEVGDNDDSSNQTIARSARITFGDSRHPETSRTIYQPRQPGLQRSKSQDTIASTRSGVQSPNTTGIPIEFRTVSFQVSETQRAREEALKLRQGKEKHPDHDYFDNLEYHLLTIENLAQQLNVDCRYGLSETAAASRLQRDGKNTISRYRENYLKKILGYVFGGFCSVLWVGVIVFFLCWKPLSNPPSVPSLAMAILILIVILLQASFSAFQDWSTKHVMNSILNLLPSEALVLRDGKQTRIPSTEIVAGDIVTVSIGDKVPADMRLFQSSGDVRFDRAVLTGESDEVEGATDSTEDNFLETRNIAFMGTGVTNGNAVGIVVLTGSRSVMGRIAKTTTAVKPKPTLIQREITRFVRIIISMTLFLVLLILLTWAGWLRVDHHDFMDVAAMLNNVMGCVVAFIPEGVPIGVALTLMVIAKRMKQANILPKGLATVETLGCVNVICSDKTGTLTQNKMSVKSLGLLDTVFDVNELLTSDTGNHPISLDPLLRGSRLCNDAFFDPEAMSLPISDRTVTGNATDAAVLRFAEAVLPNDLNLESQYERIHQIPFNSKNKWALTMHKDPDNTGDYLVFVKGAPDVLLPKCTSYLSGVDNGIKPLDDNARTMLSGFQADLSRRAERVIVICQRHYTARAAVGTNDFNDEILTEGVQDLTVIGIFGIFDPPRPETAHTVAACRSAGARFFMVTGDFGLTAAAIAREIGLFSGNADPDTINDLIYDTSDDDEEKKKKASLQSRRSLLVDGSHISSLVEEQWDVICKYEEIVFARTTPEQKLRIVQELKARHNIVAVTGDGVNDAPALRAADIGIAVASGSDVAIEAADLVLMDKFDSIVEAIRLGRLVFQNLQKLIAYLLPAGSWSEIWPVLMNVFFGVPLPLSSFLMIIICVFTDCFLALSLIMEKEEFDLLSMPPRNHRKDHLINLKIYAQSYLFIGVIEAFCAHCMFFLYMYREAGIPFHALVFAFEKYTAGFYGYSQEELTHFNNVGQGVYFVTLVIMQWGNILSVRNKRMSILQADPVRKQRRNPWLPLAILISLAIAVFVTEVPGFHTLFDTASVPLEYWFIPLGLALGVLCMDEFRKLIVRMFPKSIIGRIAW